MTKLVETSVSAVVDSPTPLEIWEVSLDDSTTIKFNERLLVPFTVLDEGTTGECYFAELKEIGISAVGVDLGELRSCLHSDIRMTWKRVFTKSTDKLTPKDRDIRQRFRKLAEEISIERVV